MGLFLIKRKNYHCSHLSHIFYVVRVTDQTMSKYLTETMHHLIRMNLKIKPNKKPGIL